MSPNEFQLRSALRDGEGEHVNPDTVIARARGVQQARHDRRVRYGSVAAAVAIVGGIGVTGGVVLTGGDHHDSASANKGGTNYSADQAAGGRAAASGSAAAKGSGVSRPVAPGPNPAAAVLPCPDSPPKLLLPGGGGSGQFGAQGALFSDPVASVKICAYTSNVTNAVPSTVLTGGSATDLTKSLEQADKTLSGSMKCPGSVPIAGGARTLVIIGVDKDGRQLKPVVVTLSCPTRVTNGTALRFNWTPPANLAKLIYTIPISLSPSGKVIGSPINS